MGLFEAFRQFEGFARYPSNRSAVTVDKDFIAVIYVCVLVFLASVLTAFGNRGKERWTSVIRVAYSIIVSSVILVCLYGHGWQQGEVTAETIYLYRSAEKIKATIGIKMNLVNVNITLTGQYGSNKGDVNYNERLSWRDVGELETEFHRKLVQGLPAPLITVAEYISVDCGGFRWGRYFREAGYYSYILLWSSFAFWLVTIILMWSVVFFGSLMFILSGLTMCLTVLIYDLLQPSHPLRIPFGEQILRLHYGWCFYLLFTTGIITTILGVIIFVFNYIEPKETATFFGLENELIEADDTAQHLSSALEVNQVVERPFLPKSYSNLGFIANSDPELSRSKGTSLPELKADTSEIMTDNESACLSISSLDRKPVHQRFVCVSIPDNVELFSENDNFKLPIEEPSNFNGEIEESSNSNDEIVSTLEENQETDYPSTKF